MVVAKRGRCGACAGPLCVVAVFDDLLGSGRLFRSLAPSQDVDGVVARDRVEPMRGLPVGAMLAVAGVEAQQSLLGGFLGLGVVTEGAFEVGAQAS